MIRHLFFGVALMTFPIFAVLWTVHCSRHLMRLGAVRGFWFSYFHSTDLLQFFCIRYKPIGLKITGEFDISVYSGKIIECNWDWEKQCWAFMRIRTDKATPNDLRTYSKVISLPQFSLFQLVEKSRSSHIYYQAGGFICLNAW